MPKEIKEVLVNVIQRVVKHCSEHYDQYKLLSEDDISYIAEKVNSSLIKRDVDFGKINIEVFDNYDEHTFDCKIPIESTNKNLKGSAYKKSFEKNIAEYLTEQLITELHLPITPTAPEEEQIKEMERKSETEIRDIAYAYLEQLYKKVTSSNLDISEDELFNIISKLFELFKQANVPPSKYEELFNRILVTPSEEMKNKLESVMNILNDYKNSKIGIYDAVDAVLVVLGLRDHLIIKEAEKLEKAPKTESQEVTKEAEEEKKPTVDIVQLRSIIKRTQPPAVWVFKLKGDLYVLIKGKIYAVRDKDLYTRLNSLLERALEAAFRPHGAIGVAFTPKINSENGNIYLAYRPPYLIFNGREMDETWHITAKLVRVNKDYNICLFVAGENVYLYNNCNLTEEDEGSIYALSNQGYQLIKKQIK